MKPLWTLVKVVLVLALAIPIGIVVLTTALGLFGALLGLALLTLRIALIGLVAWGAFRLIGWMFRSPATPHSEPSQLRELPTRVDPHYEAALRELDRELGEVRR